MYCKQMIDAKDVHDANYCEFVELCYDYLGYWKIKNVIFSNTIGDSNNITYADFVQPLQISCLYWPPTQNNTAS